MRVLASAGLLIALVSASGAVGASPAPFLPRQRAVPPSMRLPLSGMPFGQRPQTPLTPVGTDHVLHAFSSGADGAIPEGTLAYANGVFYGTTYAGGKYNFGTVFVMTPAGTERVLHTFTGGADGARPAAGLHDANGVFYGTTYAGGKYNLGTVFAMNAAGTERVLHSFGGAGDGAKPVAGLVEVNGVLYGTTRDGGKYGSGTVFAVTPAGMERVLHSFGHGADGANPVDSLINVNGILYGTTENGGFLDYGTVFEVTLAGTEHVLHAFFGVDDSDQADGAYPEAGLTYLNGVFYGTTEYGGDGDDEGDAGIVFSMTPIGTEKELYAFEGFSDASNPVARLVNVNGVLYGTTFDGGNNGSGTVFSVTVAGHERVLHSFGNPGDGDGNSPVAGLIDVNDVLYGTTQHGGTHSYGTVFSLPL